jgi:hypothetical protein
MIPGTLLRRRERRELLPPRAPASPYPAYPEALDAPPAPQPAAVAPTNPVAGTRADRPGPGDAGGPAWFQRPPVPAEPPATAGAAGAPVPEEGFGRGWATPADAGWQAVSALDRSAGPPAEQTAGGLPSRRPMANLVPGGVPGEQQPAGVRRSPEAIRGLLSSYQRGVLRGRTSVGEPPREDASW